MILWITIIDIFWIVFSIYILRNMLPSIYYKFLLTGEKNEIIILGLITFVMLLFMLSLLLRDPTFLIIYLILYLIVVLSLYIGSRFMKCKSKEDLDITDGIKVSICRTKNEYLNAWYNYKEKTIYITESLKNILTNEELKLIIKHELGHHKNRFKSVLIRPLSVSSILFLPLFLIIQIISVSSQYFDFTIERLILFIVAFVFYILIFTISSLILWIDEHEADKNVVKSYDDLKNFIRALIKIKAVNYLKASKLEPFIIFKIENINEIIDFNFNKIHMFEEFRKDLYSYLLKGIVLSIEDLLLLGKYPIISHPPIKFRLVYLINMLNKS